MEILRILQNTGNWHPFSATHASPWKRQLQEILNSMTCHPQPKAKLYRSKVHLNSPTFTFNCHLERNFRMEDKNQRQLLRVINTVVTKSSGRYSTLCEEIVGARRLNLLLCVQDDIHKVCFFLKNFWRTQVLLVEPLTPLFWTSGDFCSGFQSQGLSPCLRASLPACNGFISGLTSANLLAGSIHKVEYRRR